MQSGSALSCRASTRTGAGRLGKERRTGSRRADEEKADRGRPAVGSDGRATLGNGDGASALASQRAWTACGGGEERSGVVDWLL
jgi:hypothetical protein